jgi:hypothetical protein
MIFGLAINFHASMCHDGQKVGRRISASREDCPFGLKLRNSCPYIFQVDAFLDPIVFQPHVLHDYWTASVGLVKSLENARASATYEIRSMIGQRAGGDIRLSANFIFVSYLVVD